MKQEVNIFPFLIAFSIYWYVANIIKDWQIFVLISAGMVLLFGWMVKSQIDPDDKDPDGEA